MKTVLLIALVETTLLLLFWVFSPTAAYILTIVCSMIAFAVLIVSLIADAIEKSRITPIYYYAMGVTIGLPWLLYAVISLF